MVVTFLLGLIGDDISLSRTPAMHEAEGLAQGHATVYRRIDTLTRPAVLDTLLESAIAMGFDGLNITHPYKQKVLPLLDRVDPRAQALGAVNTVVINAQGHTTGYNTDVSGYRRSLGESAQGRVIVQMGAGGAGAAVAHGLVDGGAEKVLIADVEQARARELAHAINTATGTTRVQGITMDGVEAEIASADGVVNATPVGMLAHPGTPFDVSCLTARHWVSDVIYMPLETELLRRARTLGCDTLDGTGMAVAQAVDAFELFTGLQADEARMRATFLNTVSA